MKYEQKLFLKENLCAVQFSCVRSSHDLCARKHMHNISQLTGNIAHAIY